MFLPYGDNLAAKERAWGVMFLVAVLAALNFPLFFVPEWHETAVRVGGFFPVLFSAAPLPSSYRLLTATALHGDFFHLAGNVLFLVVFGRTLEHLFGTKLFLVAFPGLGVVGLLVHWAMYAASPAPVIGASGAIAALMGAYLPLFPTAKIRMILFLGFWWRFTVPAWVFLPYWITLQLISVILGSQDGVAYAVHAGGFAFGVIAAIIWKTSYPFAEETLATFTHKTFRPARSI